jgi:hypothetical protein
LTATSPWQSDFGVHPTIPVDHDYDFACGAIDIDDDLLNQSADDALL